MIRLPAPRPGQQHAVAFVQRHLGHLVCDDVAASARFAGGQVAADAALAAFDVTGYARRRNDVFPVERRGASQLSPYIRHGLLQLREVWDHVAGGPPRDVAKFRDELLWQEYARHWYARRGARTRTGTRRELAAVGAGERAWAGDMACIDVAVRELHRDGWLVNQTRMWLASQWSVRCGRPWREGEDEFFRHLLDGSRAANRLGWQWTTAVGSSRPYGFSRWQVEKRAPGLCGSCRHDADCPIADWPDDPVYVAGITDEEAGPSASLEGPDEVCRREDPDGVWLTAESLGAADPALAAHPEHPIVFVFDEPLLRTLQLSGKRLVFLAETLAELGANHELELFLGEPTRVLEGRSVAVTHAPVPGFRARAAAIEPAEAHPWPWLCRPAGGPVSSFSAWRRAIVAPSGA